MKSLIRICFVFIVIIVICGQSTFSQENISSTSFGFSASFQDNQFDFLIPIRISPKVTVSPAFGFTWIQDAGTDLHIGFVPKIYLSQNKVCPFISLRAALLRVMPSEGDGATDWLLGLAFGGEYFFDANFSFGIESQLNYTISDKRSSRFGNPGKSNLNTAAALFASIYF